MNDNTILNFMHNFFPFNILMMYKADYKTVTFVSLVASLETWDPVKLKDTKRKS